MSEKHYSKEETDNKIQEWILRFNEIREIEMTVKDFMIVFNIMYDDFLWHESFEKSLQYQYDLEKNQKYHYPR